MREIKFRAWDEKNKKMRYWPCPDQLTYWKDGRLVWFDAFGGRLLLSLTDPEQYIGLKDKNGKGTNEVYEGDKVICSCVNTPKHRFKGVIKYNVPEFYLACFWEEIGGEQYSYPVGDNSRSLTPGFWSIDEIIGNIHEGEDE